MLLVIDHCWFHALPYPKVYCQRPGQRDFLRCFHCARLLLQEVFPAESWQKI